LTLLFIYREIGKISKGKSPWPSVTSMSRIRRRKPVQVQDEDEDKEEEIGAG